MRLYSTLIFPRLCDLLLNQPLLAKRRREQLAEVEGEILEVGVGTGLNLPHYPSHVRKIATVDPNPGMNKKLRERIEQTGIEVDQRIARSEGLPFADETFDFVVSTLTLCSIAQVEMAVQEIHRVLRPGGRFVFLEHGLSDDRKVQKWQRRLNPIQRVIGDGCRLDVDVRQVLGASPFGSVEIKNFYLEKTPPSARLRLSRFSEEMTLPSEC
jgi:ubiquinone/menaquinone biosynthesis C-methylase UbiE